MSHITLDTNENQNHQEEYLKNTGTYAANILAEIFRNQDIYYSDITGLHYKNMDDQDGYDQYIECVIAEINQHTIDIKFPFEISSIVGAPIPNDLCCSVSTRWNIEKLFKDYEEGYLLPFYTMLYLDIVIENNDCYWRWLDKTLTPKFALGSELDKGLLNRACETKLNAELKSLKRHNLMESIKGQSN